MHPPQNDDLSEAFFTSWRRLRRGDAMRRINPLFVSIADRALGSPGGLGGSEADILQVLVSHPSGCEMSAMASMVGLDPGNLTRTVEALEKKGLVTRRSGEADSRKRILQLTAAGTMIGDLSVRLRTEVFLRATADMTADERASFVRALGRVVQNLAALDPGSLIAEASESGKALRSTLQTG